ncbi:phosphoribosyltransferase [Candidatus Beckwithbacteria bacterium]|nr:phosphoribosyltransferase [Candidatus Beckwithbacteria bacterium]
MQLKPISFSGEKITYLAPTWKQLESLAFNLAQKIIKDGLKIDRIVTLAKGGWPMTRSLVDFLKVDKVASIGVKFYSGINQRLEKPEIYQDLPVCVKDEKVLLFDDVADSGESLLFVKNYLLSCGVKEIKTAALFYKSHSKIEPDFWGAKTDAWIIFPYEAIESINILGKKWEQKGFSKSEIETRFAKMNFKKDWVNYFMNL